MEWAHAIAPDASFLVVEAASDRASDLMAAVNFARHSPGVSVVSMSWGGTEFRGQANLRPLFHHAGRPQRGHLRDCQRGLGRQVRSGVAGVFPERRGRGRNLAPRGRRWQCAVRGRPGPTAEAD